MKELISILGGDIWNDNGVWRTNGLDAPGDHSGVTLDRFRVEAGALLARSRNGEDVRLLVQCGLGTEERPSVASVMKRELIELGVPESEIILEETSSSTYTQLLALQTFLREARPERTSIITSEWHIPRVRAMCEHFPDLADIRRYAIEFIGAEECLVRLDPAQYAEVIAGIRARPDVRARIAKEAKGVEQILAGTYTVRNDQPPHH